MRILDTDLVQLFRPGFDSPPHQIVMPSTTLARARRTWPAFSWFSHASSSPSAAIAAVTNFCPLIGARFFWPAASSLAWSLARCVRHSVNSRSMAGTFSESASVRFLRPLLILRSKSATLLWSDRTACESSRFLPSPSLPWRWRRRPYFPPSVPGPPEQRHVPRPQREPISCPHRRRHPVRASSTNSIGALSLGSGPSPCYRACGPRNVRTATVRSACTDGEPRHGLAALLDRRQPPPSCAGPAGKSFGQ